MLPRVAALAALLPLLLVLSAASCGGDDSGEGSCAADLGRVTYREHVQFVIYRYCIECHDVTKKTAAERQGAVLTHNYNSYALITSPPPAIVDGQPVAQDSRAADMLRFINDTEPDKVMPPPRYQKPMDRCSKRTFEAWVDQGTPE